MDDIIILAQTKRQFVAARKKLFRILRQLKLKLSDAKTRMGKLHEGFHFLGIQFQVQSAASQNLPTKTPVMSATIHSRSCRRALERVCAMKQSAVYLSSRNPAILAPLGKLVGVYDGSNDRQQSSPGLVRLYQRV